MVKLLIVEGAVLLIAFIIVLTLMSISYVVAGMPNYYRKKWHDEPITDWLGGIALFVMIGDAVAIVITGAIILWGIVG